MRTRFQFLLATMLLVSIGCSDTRPESADVQSAIRNVVESDAVSGAQAENVRSFYEARSFEPAFVEPSLETERLRHAVNQLCRAGEHGLHPADYLDEALGQKIERAYAEDVPSDSVRALRLAELDVSLAAALMQYTSDVVTGRVNPREVGPAWQTPVHAVDPSRILAASLSDTSLSSIPARVANAHAEYGQLVDALEKYRAIEARGGWPTVRRGEAIEEGAGGSRVEAVIRRLAATGDLDSSMLADSTFEYTDDVAEAVSAFQRRHGLEEDGVVGESVMEAMNVPASERVRQIELNLERWRWIPSQLGSRYLYVNVPAFELHAFENGKEQLSMAVIVGEEYDDQETPVFSDTMEYVVFNPYWNIPQSIAQEEILPEARSDSDYLSRNDYEIVTSWSENADVVPPSPSNLDLVESGHYRLRQRPGSQNALGQIKFMFPNEFDIYLHDTPEEHLFDRAQRAYSHGCIRVENPAELGEFVLASEEWDAERVRSRIQAGEHATERLEEPFPVYILYWTAFVDDEGQVNFREDIYGNDDVLDKALSAQAPEQTAISCERLLAPILEQEDS